MDIVDYLSQFIGRPYIWGGNGSGVTYGGFDCSGLILEGLWAFGCYIGSDLTANGILNHCMSSGSEIKSNRITRGDLLFFGRFNASHVAMAVDGQLMIEAGGGGKHCTTAANSTGFVRIRPIASRGDLIAVYRL